MKMGPQRTFHSANDVDKYYKIVYYVVNINKNVAIQDKLDVAHDALAKLMSYDKEITVRYISSTVRSVIYNHMAKKIKDHEVKQLARVTNTDYGTTSDFSEFDFNELPISEEERQQILEFVEVDNQDLAKKYNIGKSAVSMRKQRLFTKIRKRFDNDKG